VNKYAEMFADEGLISLFPIFKSEKIILSYISTIVLDLNWRFSSSQKE